jgi:hypothetical protein
MSLKGTTIFVIALILGSIIGFGGAFFNYSHRVEELSNYVEEITSENSLINDDHTGLNEKYNLLNQQYNALESRYSELTHNYTELERRFVELEADYIDLLNDYELMVASMPLTPTPFSGDTIETEYQWYFRGKLHTLSLSVPETQYEYYKNVDRSPTSDYSVYVTHPYDDEYINAIIKKFNFIALEDGLTEHEKINLVISFVQSLPYTVDEITTPFDEYPRYPLETLVDNGGDCEDTSILTASLLTALNYDVILIAPPEHMAVGVQIDTFGAYWTYNDENYFYIETTGEGWEIGEFPDDFEESALLYELKPIPICIHEWTARWEDVNTLEVTVTVSNVGTAVASGIVVYASFDAGEDYIWNEETSDSFDLNIGKQVTITLHLSVPSNENTRLIVGIADSEGYSIDESYSEWFET